MTDPDSAPGELATDPRPARHHSESIAQTATFQALRQLPDGCDTCGHSANYCGCLRYMDDAPCCGACSHT